MKTNHSWITLCILLMIVALTACGGNVANTTASINAPTLATSPTPTTAPTPISTPVKTSIPKFVPGEVPTPIRVLKDTDASIFVDKKQTITGDNFIHNQYERPFTSKEMLYQADIDILTASSASDSDFFYFTLVMQGLDPTTHTLTGIYGIEFDRSKTGRGDMLVTVHDLKDNWSTENVKVYSDQNKDMGGINPIIANPGFKGDGYESEVKMEGKKVAFARILPGDAKVVQIAVSIKLLEDETKFLWGAWADKGVNDPQKFAYNDYFKQVEAGSPIKTSADYPLKALYSLDNTCRLPFGFCPQGIIPGMCISAPPAASPGEACGCVRLDVLSCQCFLWACK